MYRLNSVLLSHFILDLRSIYLIESSHSGVSRKSLTLQFTTHIQGNLGATLDDSWATRIESRVEEESILYSNNPLAAGLLDTGGINGNTRESRENSVVE